MESERSNSFVAQPFTCPITHDIMENPVILVEDGTTYEEEAIKEWLEENDTSPITNKELKSKEYKPNYALKQAIDIYKQTQKRLETKLTLNNFNKKQTKFTLPDVEQTGSILLESSETISYDEKDPKIIEMKQYLKNLGYRDKHIRSILKDGFYSIEDLKKITFEDLLSNNVPRGLARKLLSTLDVHTSLKKLPNDLITPKKSIHGVKLVPKSPYFTTSNDLISTKNDTLDIKLLLLGNVAVGKTSLLRRLQTNKFEGTTPTIGMEITEFNCQNTYNDEYISVQITDPCGQERFASLTTSLFRNIHGAILIYSAIDTSSFKKIDFWLEQLRQCAKHDIEIILACNKIDKLLETSSNDNSLDYNSQSIQDGIKFASDHQIPFYCTSAKSGKCVNQTFEELVSYCLNNELIYKRLLMERRQKKKKSN